MNVTRRELLKLGVAVAGGLLLRDREVFAGTVSVPKPPEPNYRVVLRGEDCSADIIDEALDRFCGLQLSTAQIAPEIKNTPAGTDIPTTDYIREIRLIQNPDKRKLAALTALSVEHNPRYMYRSPGFCNIYTADLARVLGITLPHRVNNDWLPVAQEEKGFELGAHDTQLWLERKGNLFGWKRVDYKTLDEGKLEEILRRSWNVLVSNFDTWSFFALPVNLGEDKGVWGVPFFTRASCHYFLGSFVQMFRGLVDYGSSYQWYANDLYSDKGTVGKGII